MINDNFIDYGNEKTLLAASNLSKYLGETTLFALVALFPSPEGDSWFPQVSRNMTKADLQYVLSYLTEYVEGLAE